MLILIKVIYLFYDKLDKKLSFILMLMMAGLHIFNGYYSLVTPLGMALATIMLPFKFC